MKKTNAAGSLMLLLTAAIWGTAFVAQSVGMDYVGPFTFNCVRSLLGGLSLLPVIALLARRNRAGESAAAPGNRRMLVLGGICCGVLLFVASSLQQIGISYTSVGKAGFITSLYMVMVPLIGLFMRHRVHPVVYISVVLAVLGMYLLCIKEGFSINTGDILILLCAFFFALHILVIDYFAPKADGVRMSCIQFFVCGVLSGIAMLFTEQPELSGILKAWLPIVYAGVLSCGVAYTLQIVAQKRVSPVLASLILSLESVISALAGWAVLGQALSLKELAGCGLVFAAILLAQLPDMLPRKNNNI